MALQDVPEITPGPPMPWRQAAWETDPNMDPVELPVFARLERLAHEVQGLMSPALRQAEAITALKLTNDAPD